MPVLVKVMNLPATPAESRLALATRTMSPLTSKEVTPPAVMAALVMVKPVVTVSRPELAVLPAASLTLATNLMLPVGKSALLNVNWALPPSAAIVMSG